MVKLLLLLLSAGKLGKLLLTGGTMLLSVVAYAFVFGWRYAAGFVALIFIHEMGHFLGLMAHSRRCVDTLSYYDNGKGERCALRDPKSWGSVVEYRSMLPTACDIQRCRALNK